MEFKCKTCKNPLTVSSVTTTIECTKCGRKHKLSELYEDNKKIRSAKEADYQKISSEIDEYRNRIATLQNKHTEIKTTAKYALCSVSAMAISFIGVLAFVNNDIFIGLVSVIFTVCFAFSIAMLGKISRFNVFPPEKPINGTSYLAWAILLIIVFIGIPYGLFVAKSAYSLNFDEEIKKTEAIIAEKNSQLSKLQSEIDAIDIG